MNLWWDKDCPHCGEWFTCEDVTSRDKYLVARCPFCGKSENEGAGDDLPPILDNRGIAIVRELGQEGGENG